MPKSANFIRIKADVLRIVTTIPMGRLATYGDIGHHLEVMPRHVAYILAMLSDEEKAHTPWYRVVADKGRLGKPKANGFGVSQAELLRSEGIDVSSDGTVEGFEAILVAI